MQYIFINILSIYTHFNFLLFRPPPEIFEERVSTTKIEVIFTNSSKYLQPDPTQSTLVMYSTCIMYIIITYVYLHIIYG